MKFINDYAPGMFVAILSVAALLVAVQPQGAKAKDISGKNLLQTSPNFKSSLKPRKIPNKRKPAKQNSKLDYKKFPSLVVLATGYTAGIESTGKTPDQPNYGITYSGVKVKRGKYSTIAADPSVFPIGSLLYIPGYGYGIVADTGSAIKGKRIDLYFKTVEAVYKNWGKKRVRVYILKKGNGHLSEKALQELKVS